MRNDKNTNNLEKNKIEKLTVFCGASTGVNPDYLEIAELTAKVLIKRNIKLIYGGGDKGLMGKISDTLIENGGTATGVIPDFMIDLEWANGKVSDLKVVKSMSERKQMLLELGDAVMVLPGGIGTMEEFFDVLSWSQLLIHEKPIGILNVNGYYDLLLEFISHLQEEGFVDQNTSELFLVDTDPAKLIDKMNAWEHHNKQKQIIDIEE